MPDLEARLRRWQAADLITPRQAELIAIYEEGVPPTAEAPPPSGRITATEVVAYAGVVVTLAGVGFLLGNSKLGSAGRLAVLALVALAAFAAGLTRVLDAAAPAGRRARSAAVALGAVASGGFVGYGAHVLNLMTTQRVGCPGCGSYPEEAGNVMLGAAVTLVIAGWFTLRLQASLPAIVTAGADAMVVGYGSILARLSDRALTATAWAAGAAVLAVLSHISGVRGLAREIWRFGAVLGVVVAWLLLGGDGFLYLEVAAGAVAALALAAAARFGSAGFAIAGGLGLFGFSVDIGARYFAESLGLPLVLVASGLVLLGVALALSRLLPRLRPVAAAQRVKP